MKALIDCPKLISVNLEKLMKDIFFMFNLYYKISEEEVIDIFRAFPYLFCLEGAKIQKFLGQFKKYKMSKELVLKLVSIFWIK